MLLHNRSLSTKINKMLNWSQYIALIILSVIACQIKIKKKRTNKVEERIKIALINDLIVLFTLM